VTVRFSNSTGIPVIPDNDANSNPRGMAIRFHLGERVHTDIVSHSTDGFPTHTGQEFIQFLKALMTGQIEAFLGANPAALAFVQTPKPAPSSFAHEAYFGVNAMRFVDSAGTGTFGRYRITPASGVEHLTADEVAAKGANYLFDEIEARVAQGPVKFELRAQLAEAGDVVDNATIHWPESRPVAHLGTLTLTGVVADSLAEQKHVIFDPIPRVDGIEPSDDPLLEFRAAVYLISGRKRRAA
jgi:catalase